MINQIEAILFISPKPLTKKQLIKYTGAEEEVVVQALAQLRTQYNTEKRGIRILEDGDAYQMVTAPEHAALVRTLVKEDVRGELTEPQLETLTILAYRGALTKTELEHIRGVHCGLILRNLMIRGLVDEETGSDGLSVHYRVSMDFLRFLGMHDCRELPDYERLHADERMIGALAEAKGDTL